MNCSILFFEYNILDVIEKLLPMTFSYTYTSIEYISCTLKVEGVSNTCSHKIKRFKSKSIIFVNLRKKHHVRYETIYTIC